MNPSTPRVSIITATYNWSSVLRYAIGSVLWQTFSDFEMLVVGDGCTDNSGDVVASFGDERLRWHNLPQNSGHQSAPNNAGLAMARGEFIAFLGHDDLWLPTHLEKLVAQITQTKADFVHSWTELIPPGGPRLRSVTGITPSDFYEPGISIPPSSWLHTRELWQEIGDWKHYRTTPVPPDADWLGRVIESGRKIVPQKSLTVLKFPAAMRRDCYVHQRSDEQAAFTRRIRSETDFAVRELSTLLEAHVLRHPEDIVRESPSAARGEGGATLASRLRRGLETRELPDPQYPDLADERILFGSREAEPYLWYGWSYGETAYRWTDGPEAAITFTATQNEPLELLITVAAFLIPPVVRSQTVRVLLNNTVCVEWHIDHDDGREQTAQFPAALVREKNVIQFQFPNAAAPVDFAATVDARRLAIRVEDAYLRPPRAV